MRKRRSDRWCERQLLCWAGRRQEDVYSYGRDCVRSECVREKDCGELIECTNKVMRDGKCRT